MTIQRPTHTDLQALGMFSDPSVLVLTSLASGPAHGYAIIQDVQNAVGIKLGPGTLYGVLARLQSRGLIEAVESTDRRRPYRITPQGGAVLRTHLGQLNTLATAGLARLGAR